MEERIKNLERKANFIRNQILEMIVKANRGHIGGAFSCTDILTVLYYGNILRFNAKNPDWPDRDRCILSKGHSAAAIYAVLADLGFFDKSELDKFSQCGGRLGGHPDLSIPGIEADSGSLGHGLGIAAGLALAAKTDKKDYMSVALLGDGECLEGSIWEAVMFSAQHKLNRLVAIVDHNNQCVLDHLEDCVDLTPFKDKWQAFGWEVREVDGHSIKELLEVLKDFRSCNSQKPLAIIAHTVKGKGVSFMERSIPWHHSVPKAEKLEQARKELKFRGSL